MRDITTHRLFVPLASAASMAIMGVTMTWYIAGLFGKIDVRLAVLESQQNDLKILMQHHLNQAVALWNNGGTP